MNLLLMLWWWLGVAGAQAPADPVVAPDPVANPEPVPASEPVVAARPLVIAVSELPPFVRDAEGSPTGFSMDLWSALSEANGYTWEVRAYANVAEKLRAVRSGEADVAIGGITITHERELAVDFTLPVFRTGLDILTKAPDQRFTVGMIYSALTSGRASIVFGFLLLIVGAGHLVWWAERGAEAFDDRYIPGVVEGMYWAIVTASTVGYGDKAPVRWPGRAVAALVIIVSLPMFAIFTAELTTAFTVSTLETGIQGPEDLARKRVGVVEKTTASRTMGAYGATLVRYPTLVAAVDALAQAKVDAIVHDAPALQHHAGERDGLYVVGNVFDPQQYGLAVSTGSSLREPLNRALLDVRESGQWSKIRSDWFDHHLGE